MSSENKTSLQDNFAITADLVALDAVAKKTRAWGVLVTIAASEQLRQKMQQAGQTIYAIVDLSDSTGQTAGQAAHYLTEIVHRVDLPKSRLLIYPMGKSAPTTLAGISAAEGRAQLQKFSRETGAEHYDRLGTFIHPTLQAIRQDDQSRRGDEQPVLVIFSDAEIWDWELYRDFLKDHRHFRLGFLEVGGKHAHNKIVEQVRLVNKQHSVSSARTAAELLDNVLSVPAASQAVIDVISLRLSFDQIEPFSVMDLHEKGTLASDGNKFEWHAQKSPLAATFFKRFYLFCPAKPESLRLSGRVSMSSAAQVVEEEITVQFGAAAKTLAEALPHEDERRRCMQLVEQKCVTDWHWKQELIKILINSIRKNENLPRAPFNFNCPNAEKKHCGVFNKAEEWIFRAEPSVRCRNCRQILLHTSKLETTDPKLRGANILLLEIGFSSATGMIEINDEPIGFNSKEGKAVEINNFKIYDRGKAAVLHGQLQHYKLAAVDDEFKYESAFIQENDERQLSSFDIVKPFIENFIALDAPETYYLFMDISTII